MKGGWGSEHTQPGPLFTLDLAFVQCKWEIGTPLGGHSAAGMAIEEVMCGLDLSSKVPSLAGICAPCAISGQRYTVALCSILTLEQGHEKGHRASIVT